MQPCQQGNQATSLSKPSFSPFLANTLQVQGNSGFVFGSACYNQKYNMILAYPLGGTVQFYDATTLLPLEGRENLKLDDSITSIAYNEETDTYLFGSFEGSMYLYNVPSQVLKVLRKREMQAPAIAFLNSKFYAFSEVETKKLHLGTLEKEDVISFDLKGSDCYCLHYLNQRNLLVSGLMNGSVVIYRTDKLPHLQIVGSIRAHQAGEAVLAVQSFCVKGKEYIVTVGTDNRVKIWRLIKGRMRLIKVVISEEMPYSVVYLEDYKMIVIGYESTEVKFWRFPGMKLEKTVGLSEGGVHNLFLMKDQKKIGVTNLTSNEIDFIQLERE